MLPDTVAHAELRLCFQPEIFRIETDAEAQEMCKSQSNHILSPEPVLSPRYILLLMNTLSGTEKFSAQAASLQLTELMRDWEPRVNTNSMSAEEMSETLQETFWSLQPSLQTLFVNYTDAMFS